MPIEPEHEERSRAAEESCLWGRGPDRSLVGQGVPICELFAGRYPCERKIGRSEFNPLVYQAQGYGLEKLR